MADFEETLKIVVKTQDETTAVVKKIDGELGKISKRQQTLATETGKVAKAFGGLGDVFGLIIKRSPYILGADILARVAGFRNLADLTNKSLQATSDALDSVIGKLTGYTAAVRAAEDGLDQLKKQIEDLRAAEAKGRNVVDVGFGLPLRLPPGFEKDIVRLQEVARLRQTLIDLAFKDVESVSVNRAGDVSTIIKKVARSDVEANTLRIQAVQQLQSEYDTWRTMLENVARAETAQAAAAKEAAKAEEDRARALESMQRTWKQSSTVQWSKTPFLTQAGVGMATGAVGEFVAEASARAHAKALAEVNRIGMQALMTDRARELTLRTINSVAQIGKQIALDTLLIRKQEAEVGYNVVTSEKWKGGLSGGFERINATLNVQKQMWEDIASTIQYNVGAAIGAILTDIRDAEDVMKNLLRALQQGINMAIGQAAAGWLFGSKSAKGNIFSGGNVMPFARGGIVSGPTVFPMRSGVGLMGEAGPEAIVPLRRGPDGSLGVESSGGTSVNLTLNVGSLDPRGAAEVIMANLDTISNGIASAIAAGSNRNLRAAVAGVR